MVGDFYLDKHTPMAGRYQNATMRISGAAGALLYWVRCETTESNFLHGEDCACCTHLHLQMVKMLQRDVHCKKFLYLL